MPTARAGCGIGSWRVETDRIHAMQTELEKLGATVESGPDWLRVTPPVRGGWRDAHIGTWDDHRMAMCFSLAAFGPAAAFLIRLRQQDVPRLL